MKYTFILLIPVLFVSCGIKKNNIVIDDKTKKEILIGQCDRNAFSNETFIDWFEEGYNAYEPDEQILSEIDKTESLNDIDILIIFGTWCGDSRRELPRFYKIADQFENTQLNYNLIAVDTKKSSRDKSLKGIEFSRIPTFIFYKDGTEIGRIVESTEVSLEADILNIIK